MDLNPGKLYVRLFIDDNGDGVWTTGNFEKDRQPEEVYYNPKIYEIRAFTNHEESWNINEVPVEHQKPLDITKNKPEEKKKKNRNEEERQKGQSRSNTNNPSMNVGGMGGSGMQTIGR